jgi:opacity protein-like surface antigen
VAGLAVLTIATSAAAQTRRASAAGPVPDKGMVTVDFGLGASFPNEDAAQNGLVLSAGAERYFTERLSVRGMLSGDWWDIQHRNYAGTIKPVAINGNLVYNWEHGTWHPYVTGGLGLYHFRFEEAAVDSSDTKFGVDLGGGVEYYISRRDSITGELLIHLVTDDASASLSTYGTKYWTLSGGYKKYFR